MKEIFKKKVLGLLDLPLTSEEFEAIVNMLVSNSKGCISFKSEQSVFGASGAGKETAASYFFSKISYQFIREKELDELFDICFEFKPKYYNFEFQSFWDKEKEFL